ncbi:hypothetical protein EGW08_023382 [Elysia chlorotica]|uniref:C2H2-type domain-containing protein n=1 Tax=Elysia chlorotica TaxID=188477 RepID=A0A3S1BJQ6_ELYCH|nr:hypothetical protein EGW08_023382 [Elysia chlorotica]
MLLFPFASKINFNSTQAKSVGDGYKGPVDVYYLNQRWLDAMLACCSDFRYNGSSLKILLNETQKPGQLEKFSSQSKREKKLSEADRKSQIDLSGLETLQGGPESSRSRHSSEESNTSGSEKGNDDISNMTLDVCAGMMESLDKLKEMGTDNPNILRILEMQSQLASLQNSLKKKNKRAVSESPDGPSKVESKPTRDKKEDKKKCSEMEREERNKKEVAALEAKLQESDEKEKEREQRLKEEEENQRQRNKELEERRKTKMTREMIEEAKQKRQQGGKTSEAAQRILQSIADKHHDQKQKEGAIAPQQKLAATGSDAHPLRQWSSASSSPTQVRGQGKAPELDRGSFEDNLQPMNSFMKIFPGPSSSHHRTPPLTGNIPLTPSGGRLGHIPLTPRVGHPGNTPLTPSGVCYSTAHLTPGFRGHPQSLLGPTPRPAGPDKVAVPDDDGLHSRLEEFQKELAQQGVVSPVKVHENSRSTISPDRPLHEGVPVYTEKEFHRRRKLDFGRGLPHEFYIQTTFLPNRKCPVYECPASKVFKTEPMFLDHWDMFHKPTMTMRFCRRCTAYFAQPEELHAHLIKAHGVADLVVANSMVAEARVKVVNNPSYRDPGRFLAPPV